jgi:predicted metal-dependent hydrolase
MRPAEAACDRHAAALGRQPRALSLRDTRSRWGSCTHDGRLMFSWRLAMAPPEVLDYVAAHEVAHLAHMDHSPAFWAATARLMPDYARHRAWLRAHGARTAGLALSRDDEDQGAGHAD